MEVRLFFVVAITFLAMTPGCGAHSRYSVTLVNETSVELTDARVTWNGYIFSAGILPPGIEKSEAFPDIGFPEVAEIAWRTQDGGYHRVRLDVERAIGKQSRWNNIEVLFSIRDNEIVHVSSKPGLA